MTDNKDLPAYPIHIDVPPNSERQGLTKIEAFTMAAMQGLCANPFYLETNFGKTIPGIAEDAIKIAKATLALLDPKK